MDDELRNIRQYLISRCKDIGRLLTSIPMTVDLENKEHVAAATPKGIRLFYKFFELPNSEKCGVLLHEVLHVALGHCYRGRQFHPVIMNIAEDLIINHIIINDFRDPTVRLPADGLFFDKSPYHKALKDRRAEEWTAETLYYWLLQNLPTAEADGIEVDSSYFPVDSPRRGQGDTVRLSGDVESDVERTDKTPSPEEIMRNERLLRDLEAGSSTNSLLRSILAHCKKNILPWRSLLRRHLTSVLADKRVYDYSRPTNVFLVGIDPYEPSSKAKKGIKSIAVLRDTSGSMFYEQMLTEVMRVIEDLRRQIPTTMHIIDVDTEVKQIQTIKETTHFDPKKYKPFAGGGGTDFSKGIAEINKLKPTVIIGITDGYTGSWGETKIPTYWVVTENIKAPYGKTITYTVS